MELPIHDTALWKLTVPEQVATAPVTQTVDADLSHKFNTIFFATKDRLYHFVWKLTKNETETKDIIQTCYARLWQNIATGNIIVSPGGRYILQCSIRAKIKPMILLFMPALYGWPICQLAISQSLKLRA
jgi:hypothetical protein